MMATAKATAKKTNPTAFEIDAKGLQEVIGGSDKWRHVLELVANVFDEYNGYTEGKKAPTFCEVTFTKYGNKPAELTVTDDGAGFEEVSDIWTFFRSTEKRNVSDVSGRFNVGEKQLLAMSKEATVLTNEHEVQFMEGRRKYTRHRKSRIAGTKITAKLSWTHDQYIKACEQLESVIAPDGLNYTLNGRRIDNGRNFISTVNIPLPTVKLSDVDGMVALRNTTRKTDVDVLSPSFDKDEPPTLYELGFPICELGKEFGYSLDVRQKVPLAMSRDMVQKSYIDRLIGLVIQANPKLIHNFDAGAEFLKPALEHVTDPEAMEEVLNALHDGAPLYQSSDKQANAVAAAAGREVVQRNTYGPKANKVMRENGLMESTYSEYGEKIEKATEEAARAEITCPNCQHSFNIQQALEDESSSGLGILFG